MTFRSNLVFDVGLHIGQDAEFYLAKGFDVVGVEALAELAEQTGDRLRSYIDAGRLCIENVAISEQTGPVTFYRSPISVWGTIRAHWSDRNANLGFESQGVVTVDGMIFGDLLRKHGVPYYLKVDIEGADLLCLEALKGLSTTPKYVSIESDKTSWKALLHEFELLRDLGYDRFKVIPQHKVTRQVSPDPAAEGRVTSWHFTKGASGLFGEETPGRWLTRRQALAIYVGIFVRYKLAGDKGILTPASGRRLTTRIRRVLHGIVLLVAGSPGWYDTHARRP